MLLLCFLLLQVWTIRASPDVPVSTQAIVTTITAPTVSNSLSTSQTVFESTSTFEDIQTITTTDSDGNTITTTTDNGPTSTVFEITSNVVLTIPITAYITFVSTLGQTTILGPDPTTSVSTDLDGCKFSSNMRHRPLQQQARPLLPLPQLHPLSTFLLRLQIPPRRVPTSARALLTRQQRQAASIQDQQSHQSPRRQAAHIVAPQVSPPTLLNGIKQVACPLARKQPSELPR
jgi:hypothetical protein